MCVLWIPLEPVKKKMVLHGLRGLIYGIDCFLELDLMMVTKLMVRQVLLMERNMN